MWNGHSSPEYDRFPSSYSASVRASYLIERSVRGDSVHGANPNKLASRGTVGLNFSRVVKFHLRMPGSGSEYSNRYRVAGYQVVFREDRHDGVARSVLHEAFCIDNCDD
jgi:hypothetical protein